MEWGDLKKGKLEVTEALPQVPERLTSEQCLASLGAILRAIEANDEKHEVRYGLVLMAVGVAHRAGLKAGFRIDPQEPEWPVAFIELPTGQVSWHLPQHPRAWDGHTTAEKYGRCERFIREVWERFR